MLERVMSLNNTTYSSQHVTTVYISAVIESQEVGRIQHLYSQQRQLMLISELKFFVIFWCLLMNLMLKQLISESVDRQDSNQQLFR